MQFRCLRLSPKFPKHFRGILFQIIILSKGKPWIRSWPGHLGQFWAWNSSSLITAPDSCSSLHISRVTVSSKGDINLTLLAIITGSFQHESLSYFRFRGNRSLWDLLPCFEQGYVNRALNFPPHPIRSLTLPARFPEHPCPPLTEKFS